MARENVDVDLPTARTTDVVSYGSMGVKSAAMTVNL